MTSLQTVKLVTFLSLHLSSSSLYFGSSISMSICLIIIFFLSRISKSRYSHLPTCVCMGCRASRRCSARSSCTGWEGSSCAKLTSSCRRLTLKQPASQPPCAKNAQTADNYEAGFLGVRQQLLVWHVAAHAPGLRSTSAMLAYVAQRPFAVPSARVLKGNACIHKHVC